MSKRRKKVKKKNRKIVWIIESLLFIILISLLVLLKIFNPQEREKIEEKSEETVKPLVIQTQQRKLDLDQLHSSAGIVISLDDSKVIFQFQQDEKIFPASLTKIMTCILAIENINNLEATITLEPEIFDELYAQNASMAGFLPGENAKIIDILYGNILPSGGECSIALAEYVAGSEQAFVELMNEKAKDLGMNNTHFMNATGLHNESHYTTVKDIGITELQLPLETVTELPPLAKELNFTIENYKYCEMPKKKEDILTIKLLTGAGEIQGIRFESKDNGETWAYAGISVE